MGTQLNTKEYNEHMIDLMRFYLSEFHERLLSSINMTLVILSLVMVFEATILAPILTNGITDLIPLYPLTSTCVLLGNSWFLCSLIIGLKALSVFKVPIPLFGNISQFQHIPDPSIEYLVQEYSHQRISLDYAHVAKCLVNLSHRSAVVGSCELSFGCILCLLKSLLCFEAAWAALFYIIGIIALVIINIVVAVQLFRSMCSQINSETQNSVYLIFKRACPRFVFTDIATYINRYRTELINATYSSVE